MMKYYRALILLLTVILIGCINNDPELPELPTVTSEILSTDNTTAIINIEINSSPGCYLGIIYGSSAATLVNISKTDSYYTNTSLSISNLTKNTKYYYQPFAEDNYGNRVYGVKTTFTTTNTSPIYVTTGSATNDGYYSSKYHFTLYASISSLSDVSEFGLMVSSVSSFSSYDTGTYTLSYLTEGTSKAMYWTTTSSGTRYYKAYARLNSGSYIYGEVKSIYVY